MVLIMAGISTIGPIELSHEYNCPGFRTGFMNDSDWSVETHSLVSFARPYFRPSRDLAH